LLWISSTFGEAFRSCLGRFVNTLRIGNVLGNILYNTLSSDLTFEPFRRELSR
jgi:hypothetical protein